MKFADIEIRADPNFEASCPKHRTKMIELGNGWFSVCWYCEKCEYPYELRVMKMMKVDKDGLKKALAEKKNKLKPTTRSL